MSTPNEQSLLALGARVTNNILVDYIVEYFSHYEHRTSQSIERDFVPFIMNFSPKLMGGTKMNLSMLRDKLSVNQEIYLKSIFINATHAVLTTALLRHSSTTLIFLSNFKALKHISIIVQTDDELAPTPNKTNWETLAITCVPKMRWTDPINRILENNNKTIKNFSLRNCFFSNESIATLFENNLTQLSLVDIFVYSETARDLLIACILSKPRIEFLELLYTKKHSFENHYDNFNIYFFREQKNFQMTLKTLSFTINQFETQKNYNLENLPDLKTLVVYYTTEGNFENIHYLLDEIHSNELNGVTSLNKIKFVEYFSESRTLKMMNSELINNLKRKSLFYKEKILEKTIIQIEIIPYMFDFYSQQIL